MAPSTSTEEPPPQASSTHECSYRDYANECEDPALEQDKHADNSGFPVKLHYMLSDMQADGLDHIVAWQPHGRCFIVHKPHDFGDKILPL